MSSESFLSTSHPHSTPSLLWFVLQASALPTTALPFQREAHDSLREGLPALKEGASTSHPVEALARPSPTDHDQTARVYGAALPARLQIEEQLARRHLRLPGVGVPSSQLGWRNISGDLDTVGPEDLYGRPEHEAEMGVNVHHAIEAALSMPGAKRVTHGGI